jgi:Cupredoxin-like domain
MRGCAPMPTSLLLMVTLISAMVALLSSGARTLIDQTPVEVTLTSWGCDAIQYTIPANHPPELLVRNQSSEPMVFAVTDFDQLVSVGPGEQATMPLQAFVWGRFSFLCMTEAAHDSVMGTRSTNPYYCGLDAFTLRPQALTEGKLVIEPHSRLQPFQPASVN